MREWMDVRQPGRHTPIISPEIKLFGLRPLVPRAPFFSEYRPCELTVFCFSGSAMLFA